MGEPKPVISSSADESKIQTASSNAGTLTLYWIIKTLVATVNYTVSSC